MAAAAEPLPPLAPPVEDPLPAIDRLDIGARKGKGSSWLRVILLLLLIIAVLAVLVVTGHIHFEA
jgi:hypothetical protein